MYGLQAISAANGWAIAGLGVSIVFTALILLSTTIAQLHKLLDLWDDRANLKTRLSGKSKAAAAPVPPPEPPFPREIKESARPYVMLVARIGEPFALPRLLDLSVRCGLYRPHSTLNRLLEKGVITPDGTGYFRLSDRARR